MNGTNDAENTISATCSTGPLFLFAMTTADHLCVAFSCVINGAGIFTALTGNILVILAICRNISLRCNSNLLLAVLAASDLFLGCVTQSVYIAFKTEVLLNKSSCATATAFSATAGIATMSSVVIVMAVGLERTLAVMAPFKYQVWVTPRRIFTAITSVCLAYSVLDISRFAGFELALLIGIRTVLLILCFLVILVCYGLMLRISSKHTRQIAALEQAGQSAENRKKVIRENKALKTALYVNGANFFCWVPHAVGIALYVSGVLSEKEAFMANAWMGTAFLMSASLNPVIYCWRNGDIRRAIIKLLSLDKHFATKGTNVVEMIEIKVKATNDYASS